MRIKCSKLMAGILAGVVGNAAALAHPGHSPADLSAELSQPLAGPDHLFAFTALATTLLIAFRFVLKSSLVRKEQVRNVGRK
jgi:hydrogenase/urease accessory protein HupE